jgi:hypothetical protein
MARAPAFVLPEGVVFEVKPDGVTIQNRGDVILHSSFGGAPLRVRSLEGNVELHAGLGGGSVEAAGDVRIVGDATADSIVAGGGVRVDGSARVGVVDARGGDLRVQGDASGESLSAAGALRVDGSTQVRQVRGYEVTLAGPLLHARAVQAARSVTLGASQVTVDVVFAPHVTIEPQANGRVSMLECANDLGPKALKGCFRLADWQEMFGDPVPWLAERGVDPGATQGSAAPTPVSAAPAVEAGLPVAVAAEETWNGPIDLEAVRAAAIEDARGAADPPADELPDVVDEAPAPPAPAASAPSAPVSADAGGDVHGQLMQAAARLSEAYSGTEVPRVVDELCTLVALRDYANVRSKITGMWTEIGRYHRERGTKIPVAVSPVFSQINALVRKA